MNVVAEMRLCVVGRILSGEHVRFFVEVDDDCERAESPAAGMCFAGPLRSVTTIGSRRTQRWSARSMRATTGRSGGCQRGSQAGFRSTPSRRVAAHNCLIARCSAPANVLASVFRTGQCARVSSILRWATVGACAIALFLSGASCSSSPQPLTQPADAAKRLATELGTQFDRNGLASKVASSQDLGQPWHPWDASSGRTSLKTLAGDEMNVSMDFWSDTLWSTVRAATAGDGYCLLVSSGFSPGQPIAWWVKPSGAPKGSISDQTGCASIAPS